MNPIERIALFSVVRALQAFGAEPTSNARSDRTLQKHLRAVADAGPALEMRSSDEGEHTVEPMNSDLTEVARPLSAAERLNIVHESQATPNLHVVGSTCRAVPMCCEQLCGAAAVGLPWAPVGMQDMPQTSLPAASGRHPRTGLTPRPDRIDCRQRAHTPNYIINAYSTGSTHTNQYYSIYIYIHALITGSAHACRRRRLC